MPGALEDLRVVEFAGLGPAPFACMLLADLGAEVVTIDRPGARAGDARDIVRRGRTNVQLDLKEDAARGKVMALLDHADVLVEGFRPGVMERLGLGPEAVAQRNPRLVYARMTGWGQQGPLAPTAGHDINYIALTGALHAIGPRERPVPPLNLLGDYGGGSLYLVVGILAALHERQRSGRGQVVDAAITDGVTSLMTLFTAMSLRGQFTEQRESNMLDGGAPYYACYETADGAHVSVGAIEPQFFAQLCDKLGLAPGWREAQNDRARWPALREAMTAVFRQRTRTEWERVFAGSDCCVAPVLTLGEAAKHPHNVARGACVEVDGVAQPAPAPRLSRTPATAGQVAAGVTDCDAILARWTS